MNLNEAYMLLTQEARIEQQAHMLSGMDVKHNFEANLAQNRGFKKGNFSGGRGSGNHNYLTGLDNAGNFRNNYRGGYGRSGFFGNGSVNNLNNQFKGFQSDNQRGSGSGNWNNEFFTSGAYKPPPNRNPKAAYLSDKDGAADANWYLDSGATHHLTNDMRNMTMAESFAGNSKLIIGNGTGLHITNVGNVVLRMHNSSAHNTLELNNMLFVLQIYKNLISISQLTKDNTIVIEFTDKSCFVKDKHKLVGCKWVFRTKYNTDGTVSKHKARLVAKGFHQTAGVDYKKTFSPVVKSSTVRTILSLVVMKGWKVRQIDINNIFLKGDISENIYMTQPEGFITKDGYVCKLSKALYGLKQAPKAWYDKLKGCLTSWNFFNSKADTSLFIRHDTGGSDTPLSTGQKLENVAKGCLRKEFEDPTLYRSIVGGLQYLILTRPDIAYSVHKLGQYLSAPTLQHWFSCKKIGLVIQMIEKSIGAYCIYLGNNLISWSSKKQAIVVKSSTESEYRALSSASSETSWLESLFSELNIVKLPTPVLWCDNQSAGELAKNHVFHSRSKHIELDIHYIRDKVLQKQLEVRYIPLDEQVADILTKALSLPKFSYFRFKLNVISRPLSLRGDVKEAHICSQAEDHRAEDHSSFYNQLQVYDMYCQLAPGGYVAACTHTRDNTTGSDTTWPIVVNKIELNETAKEEIQPTKMEEAQPMNETVKP
ncbi:retrovirus-related pol polyprotein from transposon RE2 [Citrus sinensis]|nr:retrovirus-related pol polyprotein from transposon RE2 [Citrus sinensis]